METRVLQVEGGLIAEVRTEDILLGSVQDALDLMATLRYELGDVDAVVLDKAAVAEDFFVLRTRLAGEILQKLVNYQLKIAIVGDYSGYTSKSLADFIRESNEGRDVFFPATREEAIALLSRALARGR